MAALVLVGRTDPRGTAPALVLAYLTAYAAGSSASYLVLNRLVGGLESAALVRFLVRMAIAAAGGTATAYLLARLLHAAQDGPPSALVAAGTVGLLTLADAVVFLVLARLLRIQEVTAVLDLVLGTVGRRKRRTNSH